LLAYNTMHHIPYEEIQYIEQQKWDVYAGKCTTLIFLDYVKHWPTFFYLTKPGIWYMFANAFLISSLQEIWNHTLIVVTNKKEIVSLPSTALVQLEGSDCVLRPRHTLATANAMTDPPCFKWGQLTPHLKQIFNQ
jgi:hypothetical protein